MIKTNRRSGDVRWTMAHERNPTRLEKIILIQTNRLSPCSFFVAKLIKKEALCYNKIRTETVLALKKKEGLR